MKKKKKSLANYPFLSSGNSTSKKGAPCPCMASLIRERDGYQLVLSVISQVKLKGLESGVIEAGSRQKVFDPSGP